MGNFINKDRIRNFLHFNLWIVLLDIAAFSLSYLLTLYIRLYVNGIFRAGEYYLDYYWHYIPYYTIAALVVFAAFRLYGGMWQYAGLHDLNRLFTANIITAVLNVGIALIVIPLVPGHEEYASRMPTSYHIIGATIQFLLTTSARFINRYFQEEKRRLSRKNALNVMLVGTGETSRIVRRQLDDDPNSGAKIVCIFSYKAYEPGALINGIPVVGNLEQLTNHIERFKVQRVILADSIMPMSVREKVISACGEANIEVQNLSGFLRYDNSSLSLRQLMECIDGKVTIFQDGNVTAFENGEQALMAFPGRNDIKSISIEDDHFFVELISYKVNPLIVFIGNKRATGDFAKKTVTFGRKIGQISPKEAEDLAA